MISFPIPSPESSTVVSYSDTVSSQLSPAVGNPFADGIYLRKMISSLELARKGRRIGLRELTLKSGLKRGTISRAERQGRIPPCREFKAWVGALDLSWDQLWTCNFPSGISPEAFSNTSP
ncbi:MAG: helix-turn-helix transcriptional regulator [Verrucomicrobiota bacterium]